MHTSLQSAWNHAAYNKEFTTPLQLDLLEKYIPKSARILTSDVAMVVACMNYIVTDIYIFRGLTFLKK